MKGGLAEGPSADCETKRTSPFCVASQISPRLNASNSSKGARRIAQGAAASLFRTTGLDGSDPLQKLRLVAEQRENEGNRKR